jgi:RNA polymerase sigma-70 factor (ECF subfamily)
MAIDIGPLLIEMLPRLRRFALGLSRSTHAADDLVQGACERALAHAASFTPGTRFDAWMFTILRNLWLDTVRRRAVERTDSGLDSASHIAGADGERETEARSTLAKVRAAIESLQDEQREIVLLVCIEDLSYREAAAVLELPVGTVMSRLARARLRLREAAGIGGEDERSALDVGRAR